MEEKQTHFERKFYLDKSTGYWISSKCPKIRAHRWVWQNVFGKIPSGCHIHHKDGNKSNNSIENLELMSRHAHLSLHMTQERREWASKRMDEIRPLTKEWHSSEEGKAWHKYHAAKNGFGKWDNRNIKCQMCSKTYQTTKKSKSHFCTNACKSAWRRAKGLDDEIRKCLACEIDFTINKYKKTKYCSRSCAQKSRIME
jgi:hypothetical protein